MGKQQNVVLFGECLAEFDSVPSLVDLWQNEQND